MLLFILYTYSMKKLHDGIHSFASRYLPDIHHLPKNAFAKNALFFLSIIGFSSMLRQQVSANTSISTSLNNNVMTIENLVVTSNGTPTWTWRVRLGAGWVQINLWSPSWVLKVDSNNYVVQWQVQWPDIENNTIEGIKIANNAITSSKLDTWSITNDKIQDGIITCTKLNLASFPWLSCTGWPVPTWSCPPWQFMQWITATWGMVCVPGNGSGSLPTCNPGESLQYTWWSRQCYIPQDSWSWSSYWDYDWWTEAIRNKNVGNVGIGINNPTSTLTVSGSVEINWSWVINTGTLASGTLGTVPGLATPDTSAVFYVNNWRVGILTKNPSYTLDVVGTIRAASIITSSDARLKTNIKVVDNALSSLLWINGYTYTLKQDGTSQYWVLAQEIEKFFPYLVSTDASWYKAVNYNGLIAPMIQAIHELDAKVQAIEEKYTSNEQRINALEKRLAK